MRKRIVTRSVVGTPTDTPHWLDVSHMVEVEVTSEEEAHPVEAALLSADQRGWRAAEQGEQTIRLLFDQPQRLKRIQLVFCEEKRKRTQQFVLRWSAGGGEFYEVVRQQYNFSPPGTIREVEDYSVDLEGVGALELRIVPDISGGVARASLERLLLA